MPPTTPTTPTASTGKLTPQQIQAIPNPGQVATQKPSTPFDWSQIPGAKEYQPSPENQSLGQRVGNDIQNSGNELNQEISGTGQYANDNPITRGFEAASTVAGGITKTAGEVLPSPVRSAMGAINTGANNVINWLGDKIGSTQIAQDFVTKYPEAANALGQAAKIGASAGNVAGTILAAGGGAKLAGVGVSKLADVGVSKLADVGVSNMKIGTEDATPEYTPKAASNSPLQVKENTNMTGGRKMISTPQDIAAGNETVDNYPKDGTNLQKAQAVSKQIATEAESNESSLEAEKITRPPQEVKAVIKNAVNDAADKSVLLQKSDPIVKNYLRAANRIVDQNDGTLAGELRVRQGLDDAYESAGGKYGNNKALDQIHRAARDAVTTDTAEHAQSTDLKASLKRQTNLYHAADILSDKAANEAENSTGRFLDKHPVAKGAARIGTRIATRTAAGTVAREIVSGIKNIGK